MTSFTKLKIQKLIRKILFYNVIKHIDNKSQTTKIEFNYPYTQFYLDDKIFHLYKRITDDISIATLYNIVIDKLISVQIILASNSTEFDKDCLEITGLTIVDLKLYIGAK